MGAVRAGVTVAAACRLERRDGDGPCRLRSSVAAAKSRQGSPPNCRTAGRRPGAKGAPTVADWRDFPNGVLLRPGEDILRTERFGKRKLIYWLTTKSLVVGQQVAVARRRR